VFAQPASTAGDAGRNATIDTFRAVAVVAVIAFHYLYRWGPDYDGQHLLLLDHAFPDWLKTGKHGVSLFFFISGLVIPRSLLASRSPIDFGVSRMARLYPAYLFAMLLTWLVVQLFGPDAMKVGPLDVAAGLTMAPEPLGFAPVDGAYWTLLVEITFYAYAALGFMLLKERFWIALLGVGVLGALLWPVTHRGAIYLFIAPHMPFFLAGLAAWYGLQARRWRPCIVLGGAAAALYLCYLERLSALDHVFVLGGAGLLLMLLATGTTFSLPGLPYLGRLSYALYLVHQNIGVTIIAQAKAHGASDWAALGAGTGLTLALAAGIHHGLELPAKRAIVGWWRGRPRVDASSEPARELSAERP
jgi:peptidoglycan/LPS O-acetylase OafA/YrhL